MTQHARVSYCFSHVWVKLGEQDLSCIQAHKDTTAEKQTTHSQSTDTLHLSIPIGELFTGRLNGPRDRGQSQKVGHKIGERVVGVGD